MEDVLINLDSFVDFFYQDFFESTPEIEAIFRNTELVLQKEQLKFGLKMIFELREKRDELDEYLIQLGIRHVAYEITPMHYEFAKRSLMKSFHHIYNGKMEKDNEGQIICFVDYICSKMHDGALSVSKAA